MTAFARESSNTPGGMLTVELRTVNHRYLDCTFKLPDSLRGLEPRLRELTGKNLARGKLDCLVRIQTQQADAGDISINEEQLQQLASAAATVSASMETRAPTALEVLQYPGVCSAPEQSEEALHSAALALFESALQTLAGNRQREGSKMAGPHRPGRGPGGGNA